MEVCNCLELRLLLWLYTADTNSEVMLVRFNNTNETELYNY